jgi:two-component system chemotaxis response regulator CheY
MAYDFSTLRILIIEDNQPLALITRDILETFGIKNIELAYNGTEGYNKFCKNNFDILFIDWAMKPMNGIDLLKKIRTDEASVDKFIPVVMVTAYNDKDRVEFARDMGATEYLIKPFKAQDIYKRLVQIIERPRQFVKTPEFFGPDRRRHISNEFNGKDRRTNKQDNEE